MAQKDKASYCQEPHRQCLQRQTHDSIITLVSDVHYYQAARAAVHSCYTSNSALRKREEVCLLFDIVARQNRSCSAHKTRVHLLSFCLFGHNYNVRSKYSGQQATLKRFGY